MMKDRRYGYLDNTNSGGMVRMKDYQQIAGYSVGIVYIENVHYPMLPGNVVNAYTYDYPVRMKAVSGINNARVFAGDPTILDDVIAAAKHMVEKEGVRAICSACGFFGNFHRDVAKALDVPVALSSLVQIPWIRALLKPGQKIGILTANKASLTPDLLNSCCVEDHSNLIIKDLMQAKEFSAVMEDRGAFDNTKAEKEVVAAALELFEDSDDIGAILLECSDMPPYAAAVQAATQVPVFDFITLINWLHNATTQRPYSGWI